MDKKIKRSSFMKGSAAAAAGTFVLPRFSIGKPGPSANSKLNIAMIGTGNIARMAFEGCNTENIVALADVDSGQFSQYADKYPQIENAKKFSDYRVMLDKMGKEIDGVCVNVPDHSHFPATMACMERGIHVITQKPLAHNIWQVRTLRKAMHKYNVITNMGNQGHTYDGIRQMREWVEAGVFGQIKEVHLGFPGPDWNSRYFKKPSAMPPPKQPVPANLDWNLWLGPTAKPVDYNEIYHPQTWRGFFDFGTGELGDWFCHIGDGPVWILDLYEPVTVECIEKEGPTFQGMELDSSVVRWDFAARGSKAPCSMYWHDGDKKNKKNITKVPEEWDTKNLGKPPTAGSYWFGEKQNGFLDNRSNHPRLTTKQAMMDFHKGADIPQKYARVKQNGPHAEWVAAVKGEIKECGANFDFAAGLTETALLGVLAKRFGGRIEWDPVKCIVKNRPELNVFIKEPVRKGWEYGEDLWRS